MPIFRARTSSIHPVTWKNATAFSASCGDEPSRWRNSCGLTTDVKYVAYLVRRGGGVSFENRFLSTVGVAFVLFTCFELDWSRQSDSNRRPADYKSDRHFICKLLLPSIFCG